jgi:hypothetical protein
MPDATTIRGGTWLRVAAFAAGLAVVATAVVSWRIPGGDGRPGSDVVIAVAPTGELGLSETGPVVQGTNLRSGDGVGGSFDVRNQTGAGLAVTARALPSSSDLDDLLLVTITAGGEQIFSGTMGTLRQGTREFVLEAGDSRHIDVRATLTGSDDGSAARAVAADLELDTERRW